MDWWIWLIIGFGLICFEMFIPSGFALLIIGTSFVITGIAAALGLNDPAWVEWLICFISFVVLFFSIRKPLLKMTGLDAPSNYNENQGKEVRIISDIQPGETGQGEMQGTQWKVRNIGSHVLSAGEKLAVSNIDGLTVEVKK